MKYINGRISLFIAIITFSIYVLSHDFILDIFSADVIVQLIILNERNSASNSTEVWIKEISDGGQSIPLSDIELSTGWYAKDGLIYSPGTLDASIFELHLKNKNNSKIVFLTHSWGGIIELKCGEETEKIDLYSINSDITEVDLSAFPGTTGAKTVGDLLFEVGYIAFIYLLLIFVWKLLSNSPRRFLPYEVALIHFLTSFVTDKNFFLYNAQDNYIRLIIYKSLYLVFLLIMWKIIFSVYGRIQQGDSRIRRLVKIFLIYFSVNLVLLILVWPGNWVWDEYFILDTVRYLNMEVWQHYITGIFYVLSLMLIPFPAGILIVQIGLISGFLSAALVMIEEETKNDKLTYILLLVFLFPPILRQNFYPIRLSIYAFMEFFYSVYIIRYKEQIFNSYRNCLLVGVTVSLLAVWRSEGILILVASLFYCFIQYLRYKKNLRWICMLALIMTIGTFVLKVPQNFLEEHTGRKYSYQMTAIIESFDDLIKKEYELLPDSKVLDEINRYIDVEMLVNMESGERAFFDGATRQDITEDSLKELKENYVKLVVKYPLMFVKERAEFFLISAGGRGISDSSPLFIYDNTVYNDENHAVVRFREQYNYNYPIDINLRAKLLSIINGCHLDGSNSILYSFFYNVIFAVIAIVVFWVISIKKLEWEKITVGFIYLTQLAAIIICSPGKYFMYYISIYILGNALIILSLYKIIITMKSKTRRSSNPKG